MNKKDLDYYLNLPYTIEITKIPDDEGGGYTACIPELGRWAFVGDGETPEQALTDLENIKRHLFSEFLRNGKEIPLPKQITQNYSGKFVIRVPKTLHYTLAKQAEENQTSLNQYLVYLLSQAIIPEKFEKKIDECITKIQFEFQKQIIDLTKTTETLKQQLYSIKKPSEYEFINSCEIYKMSA